jgi:hypothetical protein
MSARAKGDANRTAAHRVLAGSSLTSTFRIASGWCSPASPTRVYERSNPWGPSTCISQVSFARDPTIDTRHCPATSLSTCSMPARISLCARESPVLCISIVTAMSPSVYRAFSNYFSSKPVKPRGRHQSIVFRPVLPKFSLKSGERDTRFRGEAYFASNRFRERYLEENARKR